MARQFQDYVRKIINHEKTTGYYKVFLVVLNVFPLTRAFLLAKKGEIVRPLKLLRFGTFHIKEAKLLKSRLADMDCYLKQPEEKTTPERSKRSMKPFNGKVLLAFHSLGAFDPSGYATRSIALLTALKKAGLSVFPIVRPGYPWDLTQHVSSSKTTHIEYQGSVFRLFPESPVSLRSPECQYIEEYANLICEQVKDHDISILHAASNYLNGIAVARAGARSGVKSVYELRGLWHLTRAFSDPDYASTEHYQYVEKRELEACHCVDQVITLSDAMAGWLALRGINREKIAVVGNASFTPVSDIEKRLGSSARRNLGISDSAFVLGYLGSIVEYEGLDNLIKTHAKFAKADRPVLLFVGSGKSENRLKALVTEVGTSDHVIFAGRVGPADVSMYYHAMDAVALPRKDDTLTRLVPAIKPFEVIAHGKPLLISGALGNALRGTMSEEAYTVVDFSDSQSLLEALAAIRKHSVSICAPTWDDRAREIIGVYQSRSGSAEVFE